MIGVFRIQQLIKEAHEAVMGVNVKLTDAMQVVAFEFILRELIDAEHEAMES